MLAIYENAGEKRAGVVLLSTLFRAEPLFAIVVIIIVALYVLWNLFTAIQAIHGLSSSVLFIERFSNSCSPCD
jgi:hypothetical protein